MAEENPNSDGTEEEYFSRLRREVEHEIDNYVYEVPEGAVGKPMADSVVNAGLAQMRTSLVQPYWVEVEIRDTFEQIGMTDAPRRRCVVVADDDNGFLLLFDPVENSFVLAQRMPELTTIGVRGDAVGCFLAR